MIPNDQFGILLQTWSDLVRKDRARQGLAPLSGEAGSVEIGQEALTIERRAPRCVIVPLGFANLRHEQPMPVPTAAGMRAAINPKMLAAIDITFDAHCWGDEWPAQPTAAAPIPLFWSYNTALEIWRELYAAMYRSVSGVTVKVGEARFEQPTDLARSGRLLVVSFSIHAQLTDAPLVSLPLGAHPDVEISIATDPDAGTIVVPPS